jgi:hypothetical protein
VGRLDEQRAVDRAAGLLELAITRMVELAETTSVPAPGGRAAYDRGGLALRRRCAEILVKAGSAEPERHTRLLLTWLDGTIFDSLAGPGSRNPPELPELVLSARDLLAAMGPASG